MHELLSIFAIIHHVSCHIHKCRLCQLLQTYTMYRYTCTLFTLHNFCIALNQCIKGELKFPQTTMWIGWVESNFTNPTVKVWADIWIIHLRVLSDYMQSCVCRGCRPLWMEICQNMWYHKRTTPHWLCTRYTYMYRFSQFFIVLGYQ